VAEAVRAPFPWFGGKRRVADVVWRAFGPDCPNYIEPFAGSLAVLLARPGGAGKIETVNDRDRYLANFWRAVSADPEAVARWADWPVNEADLHARHKWLVNQSEFRERMHTDPDFYDVKIAGWWVWGLCQWIGGGWCVEPQAKGKKPPKLDGIGKGVHSDTGHGKARNERARTRPKMSGTNAGEGRGVGSGGRGVHGDTSHQRKRPVLDGTSLGRGVHSEGASPELAAIKSGMMPWLASPGNGINAPSAYDVDAYSPGRRPTLSSAGGGVHLPSLGNDRGLNGVAAAPCVDWFRALQQRLRRVRVACGDWQRVLGDSVLGKGKNVGGRRPCAVFLDPPYSHEFRDPYLYSEDDAKVSDKVRVWAIEHGDDPDLRIALCGYAGEHEMPKSWTEHAWKGARGYAAEGNANRELERIWFSPHCLPIEQQRGLFDLQDREKLYPGDQPPVVKGLP
jgi:hypothetical protein